jgi:hypothetical protein
MSLTPKKRAALYAMFDGHCAYCGVVLPEKGWHSDHVDPVMRESKMVRVDGTFGRYKFVQTGKLDMPQNDRDDNFFPACRACNIDKSCNSIEGWRGQLERRPQVCRDNYSAFRHAERFGLVAQVKTSVVFYFETFTRSGDAPPG